MHRVLAVFGTRPEAIKMAPLIKKMNNTENNEVIVVNTGQHADMVKPVLDLFDIKTDYDLNIMTEKQSLDKITSTIIQEFSLVLEKERPDLVLVHGDTSTTFSAALSCFYKSIPIGHVEAGLRTNNLNSPFPEEFNRQVVSKISTLHFAPTITTKNNLMREGITKNIYVTGNTAIDSLSYTLDGKIPKEISNWLGNDKLILLTTHRRENIGKPMENIFKAINQICNEHKNVKVLFPIHFNPKVREIARRIFSSDKIKIIEPLNFQEFHNVISKSYLILTDSGGIQEEAPALNKPVLVLRETTERPEGVDAGTLKLVGTDSEEIFYSVSTLLNSNEEYFKMSNAKNPYGDGTASDKISDAINDYFKNI